MTNVVNVLERARVFVGHSFHGFGFVFSTYWSAVLKRNSFQHYLDTVTQHSVYQAWGRNSNEIKADGLPTNPSHRETFLYSYFVCEVISGMKHAHPSLYLIPDCKYLCQRWCEKKNISLPVPSGAFKHLKSSYSDSIGHTGPKVGLCVMCETSIQFKLHILRLDLIYSKE